MSEAAAAGKRIFITGGASGLGRALAERYARAGWRVCIGDLDVERCADALAAIRVHSPQGWARSCRERWLENSFRDLPIRIDPINF